MDEFGLPKSAGPGGAGGACTNSMLRFLHDDKADDTWVSVLVGMQSYLKEKGYDQIPQLSAGTALDLRAKFSVLNPRATPGGAPGRTRALLIGRASSVYSTVRTST